MWIEEEIDVGHLALYLRASQHWQTNNFTSASMRKASFAFTLYP